MRKILCAVTLAIMLQNGTAAQTLRNPIGPGSSLIYQSLPDDIPMVQEEPKYIIILPSHRFSKPTLRDRLIATANKVKHAPAKAWHATKAGAKMAKSGVKKVGKKIIELNEKAKPSVDVINTGTALGGALYFWSKLFQR